MDGLIICAGTGWTRDEISNSRNVGLLEGNFSKVELEGNSALLAAQMQGNKTFFQAMLTSLLIIKIIRQGFDRNIYSQAMHR